MQEEFININKLQLVTKVSLTMLLQLHKKAHGVHASTHCSLTVLCFRSTQRFDAIRMNGKARIVNQAGKNHFP